MKTNGAGAVCPVTDVTYLSATVGEVCYIVCRSGAENTGLILTAIV